MELSSKVLITHHSQLPSQWVRQKIVVNLVSFTVEKKFWVGNVFLLHDKLFI